MNTYSVPVLLVIAAIGGIVYLNSRSVETDAERNERIIMEVKRCEAAGLYPHIYFSYRYTVTCLEKKP